MIRHVTPVARRKATGSVARVYDGMRREFGIHAEAIALHSPAPDVLAGAWMLCRELTVAQGRVDRPLKEVVATTVSYVNRCPFCVDAHAIMLGALGSLDVARDIDAGRVGEIDDPALARVAAWAAATRSPGAEIVRDPPFGEREAPELVGTAVLFHYINRPVSVFLTDSPLPTRNPLVHGRLLAVAARRFRSVVRVRPRAGETLDMLPAAELPPDLAWAAGSAPVAGAWARFVAAVDRAGEDALPREVRVWLEGRLADWEGEDPGLGNAWLEDSLEQLEEPHRPAGRLVLLTALAPYRVDDDAVRAYRDLLGVSDAQLVGAVAWAALAAARRVGSWLWRRSAVDLPAARSS